MFIDVVLDYFRRHPWIAAANLGLMLFVPVNEVLLPHVYGNVVDAISTGRHVTRTIMLVIAVLTVSQLDFVLRDWLNGRMQPELEAFIRERMMESVIEHHSGNTASQLSTGEMVAKFVRAPKVVMDWLFRMNDFVVPYILVMIVAVLYFWWNDSVLALIAVVMMVSLAVLLVVSPRVCMTETMQREQVLNSVHEEVEETLQNLPSIYTSGTAREEIRALRNSSELYKNVFKDTMACTQRQKFIGIPLVVVSFGLFVARCAKLVSSKRMSVPAFVSMFMVVTYMINSLTWMVSISRDVVFDWGTLRDTEALLKRVEKPPQDTAARMMQLMRLRPAQPPHPDGIGLWRVTYRYAQGIRPVLLDMTLHIEGGQHTVITGSIGTGKSTLLKLMSRLITQDAGDLYVGGRWFSDMDDHELRRRVAYVPQEAVLFNRTVVENVAYGNPHLGSQDDIAAILERLGVVAEFSNLRHGVRTRVGKNGSRLSGGQRQLIWFLRVALRQPDVMLLDEPTASMDLSTKRLMLRVLAEVMKGRTIVTVTHDPFIVEHATRTVRIGAAAGKQQEWTPAT